MLAKTLTFAMVAVGLALLVIAMPMVFAADNSTCILSKPKNGPPTCGGTCKDENGNPVACILVIATIGSDRIQHQYCLCADEEHDPPPECCIPAFKRNADQSWGRTKLGECNPDKCKPDGTCQVLQVPNSERILAGCEPK